MRRTLAVGGDALEEDTVVHLLALGQHIVYREGGEHQDLYGVFVEGFYLQYEFVVFSYAAGEFVHAHNKEYRCHHLCARA